MLYLWGRREGHTGFGREPKGKRSLKSYCSKWRYNTKIDPKVRTRVLCTFVLKRKVISTLAHRLGFPNLGPITRPNTSDHPTNFYDSYRERKASSTSTLNTAITDSRHDRRLSGSCK